MTRIAFIGAGSTVFTRNLIGDVLSLPELADTATFALMDIDAERLRTSEAVARGLVAAHGASARVEATGDRRAALAGADYVVTSFQVGGYRPATVVDFEVPKRFGLRQTIGDTLGVGGIMRGLRTIPVLLDVCRDMEELCPDALLLQYVNPMAMLCWAVAERSGVRTVGLCHSVQHTAGELAADLGLPAEEIDHHVAGINHVAFFLRLEHDGEDLYPALHRIADEGRVPEGNRVRYELMRHFGFFVTESSEHFAEYVPWFIKASRPDLIQRFEIPLDEYLRRCEAQIAGWEEMRARIAREGAAALASQRSVEYGAHIIRACETGEPFAFSGNVPNRRPDGGRLIDNLPGDCCVEVPCVAAAGGVEPRSVGALPRHLAALIQTNVNVQGLTVEAALTGRREPAWHAAMLDPHTAAELPLDEIRDLVDALLEAHGDRIPPLATGPLQRALTPRRRAAVCAISPRSRVRSERMRAAPGQAVADATATRDQRSTVSDPIQPWPIVRRGDQGHPVITLQELLRAHGQNVAADGVFGPGTETAVKAVQTSRGLPADGVVGPQTWPVTIVTVRRGSQGDAVRGVQVEIEFRNLSGAPGLAIDGIFGPLTEQSVRGFQQALSIAVDGIVGPITWRAYVSGMLSL